MLKFIYSKRVLISFLLLGVILLFIPLLRDFHIESAMLASLTGAFWAGLKGTKKSENKSDSFQAFTIIGYLYLAGTPLLFYALLSGCFSWHGMGFWLLYPIPAVYFGYSIGRLSRKWNLQYRGFLTTAVLIMIAVLPFLFEFLSFPQVYFFNHVWGGWPGPIYDEVIQVSGSLIFYRFISLCWILFLWYLPDFRKINEATLIVLFSGFALLFSYTMLTEMGIITPREHLKSVLNGSKESAHFEIFYDSTHYDHDQINLVTNELEFYLDRITNVLEMDKPDSNNKIETYLYANAWQKKRLVGAKFTSYVPVWLDTDQIHIAAQQLESLKHELVHVLAKKFGNPFINASWSIGLVEGLAVALAGTRNDQTTIDQIVAAEKPYPTAEQIKHSLSFSGFYGGRSSVNYTTAGSFVKFLLNNYPPELFKQAYRTGNIARGYPQPIDSLVSSWHRMLDSVRIDSVDRAIAGRLFSIPSILEKECPHLISSEVKAWDKHRYHLVMGDTLSAVNALEQILKEDRTDQAVMEAWAFLQLKIGNSKPVIEKAVAEDSSLLVLFFYADAFKMEGIQDKAIDYLRRIEKRLNRHPDSTLAVSLDVRLDKKQWKYHIDMTYREMLFSVDLFRGLHYRTKIRSLRLAIKKREWNLADSYADVLSELPVRERYMSDYISMIHWLAYKGRFEVARTWIDKISEKAVRLKTKELLQEEKHWVQFLMKSNVDIN